FLKPVGYHSTVLPWLYLLLTILGILTNGLATLDLWRTEKTPTVIFTLNIMVSDLMLCCSFPFRMAYYIRGSQWKADTAVCSITEFLMVSCFYINLYCNVSFLLWTSINRCVTVVRLRCRLFLVFKHPRLCWLLCLSTWIGGSSLVIGSMRYKAAIKSTGQKVESCFDQVINKNPSELNRVHCLAVGVFFFMLGLMLLSYGLLILHLHKVNQMSLVSTASASGLRVRRKIIASVVSFLICFLPYHVQRIKMIAHGDKDCTTKTVQQRSSDFCLKTLLILVAALSCCLHPVLYLVLQMPCCRAKRNTRNRPKPENYMCAPQIQTINST
ncbi:putative G-protein coupled receptor 82, partial [Silurus meridionalis]